MTKDQKDLFLEQELPNLPNKKVNHNAVEYIGLVYQGMDKFDAFKQVFPERFQRVYDRAISQRRNAKNAVLNDIGAYESGKYVQELYKLSQEHYWSHFIDKRTKLLNKLADQAMNDDLDIRDQHNAAKIFLGSVPEMKKEDKVVHEHKIVEDTQFMEQLKARKLALRKLADDDDIVEGEIV